MGKKRDRLFLGVTVGATLLAVALVKESEFTTGAVVCVSGEEANRPPASDGRFNLGRINWLPPEELTPPMSVFPVSQIPTGPTLQRALYVAEQVAARVPHGEPWSPYLTRRHFRPEKLILLYRMEALGGCGTRAMLTTLELLAAHIPARVVQWALPGTGHVLVEAWIPELQRWVLIDPSFGLYLSSDRGPDSVSTLQDPARRASLHWVSGAKPAAGVNQSSPPLFDQIQKIYWPEPWLLSRRGPRALPLFRSTFAVLSEDGGACLRWGAKRSTLIVSLFLLAWATVRYVRRRRST